MIANMSNIQKLIVDTAAASPIFLVSNANLYKYVTTKSVWFTGSPLVIVQTIGKELNTYSVFKTVLTINDGFNSGNVILKNLLHAPAPSTFAASYKSVVTDCKPDRITNVVKGTVTNIPTPIIAGNEVAASANQ